MSTPKTTQKLTIEEEDSRVNRSPSIVVLPSGQQVAFYSKVLNTGRLTYASVTFTEPSFIASVGSGTGNINGVGVSWGATTVTASPNAYELVYVNPSGTVGITTDISMTFIKDVVMLAYISSGDSSITRIEVLEGSGAYVYCRKQIFSGSSWIWDDYEIRLNTGTNPMAFHDPSTDRIYVSYLKDGLSYNRVYNYLDELTWGYLSNINISGTQINLNRAPQNSLFLTMSSGYAAMSTPVDGAFVLGVTGLSFVDDAPYVFLPFISTSIGNTIVGPITYVFFRKEGATYIEEATYTLNHINEQSNRFRAWLGTTGTKYVGIHLKSTVFTNRFYTDPIDYRTVLIFDYPALIQDGSAECLDNAYTVSLASGYEATIVKTSEYEETRSPPQLGNISYSISSGYEATVVKTSEFEETRSPPQSGSISYSISSGYVATVVVTSSQ